uniref:Uncharacterized protein n=1 Tax=Pipistrellus kuhlii TaxID=59472 RepID=A0A7J8B1Y1_PIPKU|nr:hypothetical protein mPipKuh1_007847 [Pipistrellus kuhlii]
MDIPFHLEHIPLAKTVILPLWTFPDLDLPREFPILKKSIYSALKPLTPCPRFQHQMLGSQKEEHMSLKRVKNHECTRPSGKSNELVPFWGIWCQNSGGFPGEGEPITLALITLSLLLLEK